MALWSAWFGRVLRRGGLWDFLAARVRAKAAAETTRALAEAAVEVARVQARAAVELERLRNHGTAVQILLLRPGGAVEEGDHLGWRRSIRVPGHMSSLDALPQDGATGKESADGDDVQRR